MADKRKSTPPGWAAIRDKRLAAKQLFAKKLEALMADRGWTQSELAREAAKFVVDDAKVKRGHKPTFHRDNISKYLNRSVPTLPRPEHLIPISRALGVEPEHLLPRDIPTTPKPGWQILTSNKTGRQRLVISADVTFEAVAKVMQLLKDDGALD